MNTSRQKSKARTAAAPEAAGGGAERGSEKDDFARFRDDRDFVTALARGLAVIHAFTNQARQLSISQISYRTGITRAAVRRYLYTLTALGYARCQEGGRYSLTPKAVTLGNAYLSGMPLGGQAQPILDELAETVGEACSMAVLDGTEIVYLMRASSSRIMSPSLNVGSRLPAYATSIGHILLAHLPEAELASYFAQARFLPFTANTIVTEAGLRRAFETIREEGYAIADQQMEVGLSSIAVPVVDRDGNVISGINVIANSARITLAQLRSRFLQPLRDAAKRLAELKIARS
ncbi:MAG: helix-turn-helix domain-containing protein [Lysobacter sp.]|nr:helix-turn-helix domain-containing protein [Lysobacter sp.]